MRIKSVNIKFLLGLLICSGLVYGSVTLQFFTARDVSNGVFVEWKTGEEGGTAKFEIERSADSPDNFLYMDYRDATGNNSYYSFQDNSVEYNGGRSSSIYFYRLKCVEQNGSFTYTNHITVSHTVSGIRSTWGSIKAIFR